MLSGIWANMKMGARLFVGFGAVLAICAAGGLISAIELRSVMRDVDAIVLDNIRKLELNQRMSDAVHVVARVSRDMVLHDDASLIQQERARIDAARKAYDDAWGELSRLPASEEGRRLRERIDAGRQRARPLNDRIFALAQANEDEEAMRLLLAESGPATQAWQEAIAENLRLQERNAERSYDVAQRDMRLLSTTLWGLIGCALVVGGFIAWGISRDIVRAVLEARRAMDRIAAGDLSRPLSPQGRDELADVLRAVESMRAHLASTVETVRDGVQSMAVASKEIAQGNQDFSSRTEQQAGNLQQTAASIEQISGVVASTADTAREVSRMAQGSMAAAQRGGQVVREVVSTMGEIQASSQRISDIIGVIDGIAFQTNILALNAAVEAARAGEQGRGFSVVASEVRSLAQRSATAAREIKQLIQDSVGRVRSGHELVGQAGDAMADIVQQVQQVSALIAEISAATQEQTQGISQVNSAVAELDRGTQQNAALVEEGAAAAESLRQQADRVAAAAAVFRLPQDPGR